MNNYENFRENGWKVYDDCAKVISFFCKRNPNEQPVTGRVFTPPVRDFELVLPVEKVIALLKKKYAVSRFWKPYERDAIAALQLYVDQVISEGYKKCRLSKSEYAMLMPKSKKRSTNNAN